MASVAQNQFKADLMQAVYNLTSDTIKCLLVQTGYTPDPDHQYVSSITGGPDYELNSSGGGSGYTAGYAGSGRKTLASKTVTKDDTNNWAVFDAADLVWTAINAGTARYAVFYKPNTNDADSKILMTIQFPSDAVTNGGDLTIQWNSSGIAQIV